MMILIDMLILMNLPIMMNLSILMNISIMMLYFNYNGKKHEHNVTFARSGSGGE